MTEREIENRKRVLEVSYRMHKDNLKEAMEVRSTRVDDAGNPIYDSEDANETAKKAMEEAIQPVIEEYLSLGGTVNELEEKSSKCVNDREASRYMLATMIEQEGESDPKRKMEERERMRQQLLEINRKKKEREEEYRKLTEGYSPVVQPQVQPSMQVQTETGQQAVTVNPLEAKAAAVDRIADGVVSVEGTVVTPQVPKGYSNYERVSLPSKGEAYRNKVSSIPVAYLTANDENLIVSPNLYKDGTFLDCIVSSKLMSDDLKVDDLLVGDRDAIILWLRGSSYGNMFPVTATDDATGEKFDYEVNLEELKYKPFDLKGDENGFFDFTMPNTGDHIKFRFLTVGDMRALEKAESFENLGIRRGNIGKMCGDIKDLIALDDEMDRKVKVKLLDAVATLEQYRSGIVDRDNYYTHAITNKLIRNIVSVNGVTDRAYINGYVANLNVRDANALRRYINDNAPGIDFNIDIERPQSLGGGSVNMFLSIDEFIFLNRSEDVR